ncbi:MAG: DUF3486 family protein [Candidatus Symbiopectobacterium sp. Dall1.0]|uniref:DUF3486 family protein n=1 Tax=Sodalis sp. (in: enterobacteria) TaxID=1898979 RepID=UPI001A2CEE2E|nr:DUF3486 family protein [Candidatus Symbiopectobacterium sp. Dall1.0]
MEKATRGRPGKVNVLPEDIRKRLFTLLREKRITQLQILDEVNRLIEAAGLPPEQKLSRSALNRLASENERVARDLRELREQTSALTAELGEKPTGETSRLIMEMARSLLFKGIRKHQLASQDNDEIDIDFLKEAMLAAQRLERTAEMSHKREAEIRQAYAEEAANAVSEALRGQEGMSHQMESKIRDILLGKA